MQHFFFKLSAPRPTFAMDMSEDEKALMERHAAYWSQALGRSVLVFGPVLDPSGPFGVGIARFADHAAAQVFAAGDPAITAGQGFRYDIHPMQAMTIDAQTSS
jgi:uncharacterized protein